MHVYISVPAGYTVPVAESVPMFWIRVDTLAVREGIDFTLLREPDKGRRHRFVAMGDPQVRNRRELSQLDSLLAALKRTVAQLPASSEIPVLVAGDIVFNRPKMHLPSKKSFAVLGRPVFYAIGNHDHGPIRDSETPANEEPATRRFREHYGPTYYSFNRGRVHYIVLDNIRFRGGKRDAYDIGFGGLDHVLASGENVNVMVFDTEMYSNTGGQASKASNIGEVCQFAAAGKEIGKKSLAEIAMSYGYVYVAQIALGANPAQALKAIEEAENYNGPSLIIGYAPCELHGIAKGGMNHCQDEMKKAVKAGYWNLFSFNPALKAEGKNPFTLTSKAGDGSYQDFLNNEARYTRLVKPFPERAERLFAKSEEVANERFEHLQRLVELYK